MYLRNNKVGIFDLSSMESSEQELPDETSWEKLSAVSIADALASEHGGDAVILGTGVFTASFLPAACAGIVRAGSGDRRRVAPLLGFAGVELKLSGFDFIVLKGAAEKPGYIWIRDGIIEFVPSEDLKTMDSWARTDKIRGDQGDSKVQVLAGGPWTDARSPASQLVTDYWGGEDKVGMGAELGRKNLLAVAFRGMGELELSEPESHFEDAILLMREHILKLGRNEGLASYWKGASRGDFRKLLHRNVACYGCPFPCRSYLKIHEPPHELRLVVKEPGYLHYDIPALEKAFELGLDARDTTDVLMRCARACAEPLAVLSRAAESSSKATPESVSGLLARPSDFPESKASGNFEAAFGDEKMYLECLGLGLCPRYWAKVGFDMDAIIPFCESALGLKSPEG